MPNSLNQGVPGSYLTGELWAWRGGGGAQSICYLPCYFGPPLKVWSLQGPWMCWAPATKGENGP